VKRVQRKPVTYDPIGRSVIVLDGVFAAHPSIRPLVDLAAFIEASETVQRRRFATLYRWKGFDDTAIADLWRARMTDEWSAVDAQRERCNMTVTPTTAAS